MASGVAEGRRTAAARRESILSARVRIIGAGLAGSEAAWQCARRGEEVELF
ncbi:MAG: FAD-dependent oxidoreductase, partial [Candidatus Sulfotelmatobacter sp.]